MDVDFFTQVPGRGAPVRNPGRSGPKGAQLKRVCEGPLNLGAPDRLDTPGSANLCSRHVLWCLTTWVAIDRQAPQEGLLRDNVIAFTARPSRREIDRRPEAFEGAEVIQLARATPINKSTSVHEDTFALDGVENVPKGQHIDPTGNIYRDFAIALGREREFDARIRYYMGL